MCLFNTSTVKQFIWFLFYSYYIHVHLNVNTDTLRTCSNIMGY